MRKGDLVRGWDGWLARVEGFSQYGVRVTWESGPLQGRPAHIIKDGLRKVG